MNAASVDVLRGGLVESTHTVHVVVAHADRGVTASAGDPRCVSFVRSAIKMFQALPLVEDGGIERFGLSSQEIAITIASHGGEPYHVDAARSILLKAGVSPDALACGPHPPMYEPAAATLAARGQRPGRLHNNCSGKHAGMLALAKLHDWPLDGYHEPQHPVQQRILATLARWTGESPGEVGTAVDGCGLPTFALPLECVAQACARFAAAAAAGEPAPAQIYSAMAAHPEYVAGTGRLCTELMQSTKGRLFAKVGAEGYYCAGAPDQRLGLALKVVDGAKRASEPALLAVLRALDLINESQLVSLRRFSAPSVLNTRGERVGEIRASVRLGR